MPYEPDHLTAGGSMFEDAEGYDRSINWAARLSRELPVLEAVLGPPGEGGIVDAGCGTGRQAVALAARGYSVIGTDFSPDMLRLARSVSEAEGRTVRFVETDYAHLHENIGGGHDGIYCLANSLCAAGSRDAVAEAVEQFATCLRPGGRLFIQVLNFDPMRSEDPCVRGPRVAVVDGREYVSVRLFSFTGDLVRVTNVTLFNDSGWKQHARFGTLYPAGADELGALCRDSGLEVNDRWGSYKREPFDPKHSVDLILTARRI